MFLFICCVMLSPETSEDPAKDDYQAGRKDQRSPGIGMRFGIQDMKDAEEDLGRYVETYIDIPITESLYVESRLGVNGFDEFGLNAVYFGLGLGYNVPLGKTKGMLSSDVNWAFRPSAFILYQFNDIETDAEANYDALQAGLTDFEAHAENAFGFAAAAQLVYESDRVEGSIILGYTLMDTELIASGAVSGVPVLVSEDLDLSGFFFGFSIGYKF